MTTDQVRLNTRTILRTKDGKTVVRPLVDQYTAVNINDNVGVTLTPEGIKAWNSGEPITKQHYWIIYDRRGIARADFR